MGNWLLSSIHNARAKVRAAAHVRHVDLFTTPGSAAFSSHRWSSYGINTAPSPCSQKGVRSCHPKMKPPTLACQLATVGTFGHLRLHCSPPLPLHLSITSFVSVYWLPALKEITGVTAPPPTVYYIINNVSPKSWDAVVCFYLDCPDLAWIAYFACAIRWILNYAPSIDTLYEDNMTRLWFELSQKNLKPEKSLGKRRECVFVSGGGNSTLRGFHKGHKQVRIQGAAKAFWA